MTSQLCFRNTVLITFGDAPQARVHPLSLGSWSFLSLVQPALPELMLPCKPPVSHSNSARTAPASSPDTAPTACSINLQGASRGIWDTHYLVPVPLQFHGPPLLSLLILCTQAILLTVCGHPRCLVTVQPHTHALSLPTTLLLLSTWQTSRQPKMALKWGEVCQVMTSCLVQFCCCSCHAASVFHTFV